MTNFICDEARAFGFDYKSIFQIQLAAEEVLINVVNYAYPGANGDIEIRISPQENKEFEVKVIDSGIAFDPLAKEDPDITLPMEQRQIGGLGIFLVKKIMDDVHYNREGDRNILTFMKRLPPQGCIPKD